MAGVPNTLREIHRLRRHVRELQTEIDRGPVQLKAWRAKTAKAEDAFKLAQDELKHLKVSAHEKEVTLKTTVQQVAKYERQLDDVTDTKQIEALKHQIAHGKEKVAALEDEILTALGEMDERSAKLPEQEKAAAKAKGDLAAFEADHKARLERLAAELQQTLGLLKEAETQLPPDVWPQYQRIVNAYGADALAGVHGQNCAHCHTQITSQQLHEVQTGQFVCCRSCGRGLYQSE